jgi:hypothetical protein
MTRTCTICVHPERAKIEAALVSGTAYRVIASQFGVGNNAIQRHAADHVKQQIAEHQEARDAAQALDVVKQLKAINGVTLAILNTARAAGEPELALKAIDRVQKQIELQAKLLGDLDERPQINILVSTEWLTVRSALMRALAPYAEARLAVAAALMTVEGSSSTNRSSSHDSSG